MSRFGVGFPAGYGVPGNDAFTKVLLHFDGANGSTTIADVAAGGAAKTWSPSNASLSTAKSKFGPSSLVTSAGYITTSDHPDFTLGATDWTIDFWVEFNGATGSAVFGQADAIGNVDSNSVSMTKLTAGSLLVSIRDSAGIKNLSSISNFNSLTGFNHVAVVRNGSNAILHVNGAMESSVALAGAVSDGTGDWSIGRIGAFPSNPSSAFFDEFRLSVGVARWTANFAPPDAPYI